MHSYGVLSNGLSLWRKKICKKMQKQVGVNGLIIVDLPWPDNKKFAKLCKKKIQLLLFNLYRLQHQKKE